jgi:hypothetical protein
MNHRKYGVVKFLKILYVSPFCYEEKQHHNKAKL